MTATPTYASVGSSAVEGPLVLWDIDGTLVRTGPAGAQAVTDAVRHAMGVPLDHVLPRDDTYSMSGKTDPQIIRDLLLFAGAAESDVDDRVAVAAARAEIALAAVSDQIAAEGRALDGAHAVLTALHPLAVQSVLTGNIAPNAAVKLGALGLGHLVDLDIGAYGSDSPVRDELVPVAMRRAARRHGRHWNPKDVWVIGDTPRDAACAAAGGVRCLLVATGDFSAAELARAPADAVIDDLSDVDEVVDILTA